MPPMRLPTNARRVCHNRYCNRYATHGTTGLLPRYADTTGAPPTDHRRSAPGSSKTGLALPVVASAPTRSRLPVLSFFAFLSPLSLALTAAPSSATPLASAGSAIHASCTTARSPAAAELPSCVGEAACEPETLMSTASCAPMSGTASDAFCSSGPSAPRLPICLAASGATRVRDGGPAQRQRITKQRQRCSLAWLLNTAHIFGPCALLDASWPMGPMQ
jgi:hypothetical protein